MSLAALGVLAFSFSVPMTKVAVRALDPVFAAIARAVLAGLLAVVVLAVERPPRPTQAQLRPLAGVVVGVVVGFPLLTALALHHVPSSHGVVVTGLLPLATAGCAVLRARERPSKRYWTCSAIGVVAVVAFVVDRDGVSVRPAHLLLGAAVVAAAWGYTEGALLARVIAPRHVICWALALALPATTVIAAASAWWSPPRAPTSSWLAFAYTAVISMFLGFFAWYAGLARAGIARAGQLQLAQPTLGLLWSWPVVGERPDAAAIVAIAVVLGAVAVGRTAKVGSSDSDPPGTVADQR